MAAGAGETKPASGLTALSVAEAESAPEAGETDGAALTVGGLSGVLVGAASGGAGVVYVVLSPVGAREWPLVTSAVACPDGTPAGPAAAEGAAGRRSERTGRLRSRCGGSALMPPLECRAGAAAGPLDCEVDGTGGGGYAGCDEGRSVEGAGAAALVRLVGSGSSSGS